MVKNYTALAHGNFTTIRYYIFCMFFFINLYFMRVRASTIFGLLASACLHQPACLSYEFASRCFCWIVKKTILIDYLVHIIFINTTLILSRYSHAIISFPCSFLAVNHHNSKNWVPFILTHNLWLIFMGIKKKQKLSFSTLQRAELFLPKFYRLVLGIVGLIDAKGINVTQPIWLSGCLM